MYVVSNHVNGKRLEIVSGDSRVIVDRAKTSLAHFLTSDIRARQRDGKVYVLIGTKVLEMTTPTAIKVGFALAKNGGACVCHGDLVTLEIAGEVFYLPPYVAEQLGGVIMLKADRADDWQRATLN